MQIHRLELPSTDLAAQRTFYGDVLGLPVTHADEATTEVQIRTTRLVFRAAPKDETGSHHFAFNIPRNLFPEAKAWLAKRVPLIRDRTGQDDFFFEALDARAIYFYDPAGNIGELIARESLDEERPAPFGAECVLGLSEIGIGVPDVAAAAALLQERAQIAPYVTPGESFAMIGSEEGMFILAARGRIWYPDTDIPAAYLPLEAAVSQGTRDFTLRSSMEGILLDG